MDGRVPFGSKRPSISSGNVSDLDVVEIYTEVKILRSDLGISTGGYVKNTRIASRGSVHCIQ